MRVTLLHGFAGTPDAWADVPFAGDAVPLPGHGAPMHDTWDACIASMGQHELVVGYSLGARVALGMFARGQAQRVILIGCNPGICDDRPARRMGDARWARMLREKGIAMFADAWAQQPLFDTQRRFPERMAARRERRLQLDPEGLARSLEVMGLAEMPDLSAHVQNLVAGALDAKYIALATQPITLIPDSGHDPTLEQPQLLADQLSKLARS